MVQIDTRLPLMVQQPNVLAALDAGTQAAANQNVFLRAMEGQSLFRQHGAGAMQGNANALAAIAGFDPQIAQGIQATNLDMDATRLDMTLTQERIGEVRRQAAAAARAERDQAAALKELEQAKYYMRGLGQAYLAGDAETWGIITSELGLSGIPMDESGLRLADATISGFEEGLSGIVSEGPEYGVSGGHFYDKNNPAAGAQPIPGMPQGGQETTVRLADGTEMRIGPTGTAGGGEGAVDLSSPGAFIDKIDATLNDPALDWSTGALAWTQFAPGTPMKRFQTRAKQLSGTAFMQARDALKGAGQVTDFEGSRAEDAIARLDTAQSPEDYRDALLELRGILIKGMQRPRGWIDTTAGKIMNMSAGDIDALDLTTLSAEELTAARERLIQLSTFEGE